MDTLGLKEMEKFLWEGREKGLLCWFHISFKPKVAIENCSLEKCKKKSGIMKSGLDAMPLLLRDDLLNWISKVDNRG